MLSTSTASESITFIIIDGLQARWEFSFCLLARCVWGGARRVSIITKCFFWTVRKLKRTKNKDFMFVLQLVLSLYWPLHIYSMLPHPSLPGYGKVFRSNLHLHLVVGSDHFHTTIKLGKRSTPKGENKPDLNRLNTTGVKPSQPILNQSSHPYAVPCWLHLQCPGAVSIFYVQFISES